MKRVFLLILAATLTLNVIDSARAAGLIIVDNPDEVMIFPPPDRPPGHPVPPPHIPIPPPHWHPPRPIHRFTPLEIRSVKATATIKDKVAQTKIEQEFYNPNPRRLEGTFVLPLPKGAHMEKFRMEVNGKMTEAELLTADKARGIYEEIVRKAKDPALLEYVGRDLIKVRIFPIEPNSTKKIEVSYTQILESDAGLVEYSLPLNTAKYCSTPVKNFSLKLDLQSATPLKTIYSPTHSVEVIRHGDKSATLGLEEKELSSDKDLELFYSAEKGEVGMNLLTYRTAGEDGYFMLFASPGFETGKSKVIPKDVVFVLDTSGSMSGKKLDQAKKSLLFCVNNLNEDDNFEIIRFSTETEALFSKFTPVSTDSRREAEKFIEGLKTIGGTAINDALRVALETCAKESSRPRLIVFMTDGRPTVGDTSVDGIMKTVKSKSKGLTRIFTFGVGTDVNTQLLDRVAEETRAVSQYVLPDEDTEVKLSSFFAKINDPVLADLSLDFSDVKTGRLHPGKLPDLFKGQELIVLGRYKENGRSTITLRGKVGDEEKKFTHDVQFPRESTEHDFVPRLWAMRRVGFLLEEIRDRGENAELKDEVTQLAKQYGIVTPYTSYLVTEDEPVVALGLQPSTATSSLLSPMRFSARRAVADTQARSERLLEAQVQQQSGDGAVTGARYNYALKSAVNEQEVLRGSAEVDFYAKTGRLMAKPDNASSGPAQPQAPAQKLLGQRTFRFEQGVWTETSLLDSKDQAVARVEFDSKEYWDLVTRHPELQDVLALGTQVKFRVGNKIYEIYGKNN